MYNMCNYLEKCENDVRLKLEAKFFISSFFWPKILGFKYVKTGRICLISRAFKEMLSFKMKKICNNYNKIAQSSPFYVSPS